MARSKTDYGKLKTLGSALEKWCDSNLIEWKRCSTYQWNVYIPDVQVIIAVYPGSGVVWVPKAHYVNRGVVNKSSTKYAFNSKEMMVTILESVIFAADSI